MEGPLSGEGTMGGPRGDADVAPGGAGAVPGAHPPVLARDPEGLHGFGLLLLMIVAAFALEGIATPGDWELLLLTALLGATLVLSLMVAQVRPWLISAARAVAAALILATVVQALTGGVNETAARLANGLLVGIAPTAIIVGVLRRLRATQAVTVDAVLGVVCNYILIGMFFAFLYGVVDRLGATPFFAQGDVATMSNCLYFSFVTLATVGYGDFTAATKLGHTLSISEALLGQVYLVTVVALIVGNLGRRRSR